MAPDPDLGSMRCTFLALLSILWLGCGRAQNSADQPPASFVAPDTMVAARTLTGRAVTDDAPISAIIRRIFQDSRGHFWFGSNDEGIYRYDGERLMWFSQADGLAGYQVTGIIEDRKGRIWVSTNSGISCIDGKSVVNYTTKNGLSGARVWCIFQAHNGIIWAGTDTGPCHFNGNTFMPLDLPASGGAAPGMNWCITEDPHEDLWFGTQAGACIYNGRTFRWLTRKEGLLDDNVTSILFDRNGDAWLGSFTGGVARYDGHAFTHFTAPKDIGDNEVWNLYPDRQGRIWFDSEGFGTYRYDGSALHNFGVKEGLPMLAVQSILEDREGRFWFGGAGGIYRRDGTDFLEVGRNGPW